MSTPFPLFVLRRHASDGSTRHALEHATATESERLDQRRAVPRTLGSAACPPYSTAPFLPAPTLMRAARIIAATILSSAFFSSLAAEAPTRPAAHADGGRRGPRDHVVRLPGVGTAMVARPAPDIHQKWYNWKLGVPWENQEEYARLSPLTQADKVMTPTIFLGGREDWNGPVLNAELFYQHCVGVA